MTPSAQEMFAQVAGYYKYEPTLFEVTAWQRVIDAYGDAAVVRFLVRHMERSCFMPKLHEALDMLDPSGGGDMQAFERLRSLVQQHGPYLAPSGCPADLTVAVVRLGGWVRVNEELPDPSSAAAYAAYFKRFQAALKDAQALVLREGESVAPVLVGYSRQPTVPVFRLERAL